MSKPMPWWTWTWLALGWSMAIGTGAVGIGGMVVTATNAAALIVVVFSAVHHAKMVARRVGEPFATLVLALTVTAIQVALIVSVMVGLGESASTLARETIFATFMIALNGLVGLCVLVDRERYFRRRFQASELGSALSVLVAIMTLALVLPVIANIATPVFTNAQLALTRTTSVVLYCLSVFIWPASQCSSDLETDIEKDAPTSRSTVGVRVSTNTALLVLSLAAVASLARALTTVLNSGFVWFDAPVAIIGLMIAMLVLVPDGLSAVRAARAAQLRTSMSLALKSALASVGLTIPAITLAGVLLGLPLEVGLNAKETAMFAITLFVSFITIGTGRTTTVQGSIHLAVLVSFLVLGYVDDFWASPR